MGAAEVAAEGLSYLEKLWDRVIWDGYATETCHSQSKMSSSDHDQGVSDVVLADYEIFLGSPGCQRGKNKK